MTPRAVLMQLLHSSRLRVTARVVAFAVPVVVVGTALAWRLGVSGWLWVGVTGAIATMTIAWLAMRGIDPPWLARRLDERDPRMEDSAALLFREVAQLQPLQRLQQQRLQQRLEASPPPDLRPAWPARALSATLMLAVLSTAVLLWWPVSHSRPSPRHSQAARTTAAAPTHTRIVRQRLDITPPAYTRLPSQREDGFEARVPEGTSIRWSLRFHPVPAAASLAFHDGRRIPLSRAGDDWIATRRIDSPLLYRIVVEGAPPLRPDRLHRIDMTADQPPQIRTIAPGETLTLRRAGQRTWALSFEAQDDYGMASAAPLRITLAQGEGENIRFEERSLSLQGQGSATRRRYAHAFDLAALGLSPGSDFVVQLSVTDNRAAGPQTTRSASYILRWPPEELTESSGLDGLVKKALPAYFRSQRQIIIDSEALLAQRRKLPGDQYLARSDAIGVDQRLLRLRYGQFLGEESEGAPQALRAIAGAEGAQPDCEPPQALLPTAEAEAEADAARRVCEAEAAKHAQYTAHVEKNDAEGGDGHDHDADAPAQAPTVFGSAGDVLADYGHTHDDSEAATLLDPETRRTLKAALDQMWQAELHLRQGHPDLALPYEYKALDFIKQVQQAGRVYLARMGSELPPIDESRRLSGERAGLAPRDDLLVPATPTSPLLANLWRALEMPPAAGACADGLDLDGAERWLRANERRVPDALGVIAAIDSVRNEPACATCRQLLRSRLWPLLPRPAAKPAPRARPDRSGQAYLEALQSEQR
ncbi:hypothetical protein ACFPOA_09385 [Lysobacter niabensis]|uniref:hypothetical protein n=1 Tax=Agrilutibacter niabensis TaxID=380628 RepID=UPI0036104CA6